MRKSYIDLCRRTVILMLIAFLWRTVDAMPWGHLRDATLDEGEQCQTRRSQPGICKQIENCEPYYEGLRQKTIKYSSLVRCSFKGYNEIICCPTVEGKESWSWTTNSPETNRETSRIIPGWGHLIDSPVTQTPITTEWHQPSYSYEDKIIPASWSPHLFEQSRATTVEPEIIDRPGREFRPLPSSKAIASVRRFDFGTAAKTTSIGEEMTVLNEEGSERPSQAACRRYNDLNPSSLTIHILDGLPVAPGEYPHMGGLIFSDGGGSGIDVRCGTSLISERYTLTAAHCVNDPVAQPIKVRFGVVEVEPTDGSLIPVDIEIEKIILQPEYRLSLRYHDIALIRLQRSVQFSTLIRPACLFSDLKDLDGTIPLTVIGWGVVNVSTCARSDVLLSANLTSVPLQQCNATYLEYGVSRSLKNGLGEGQYCAHDVGMEKDACQADSGGPLQLVKNRQSLIVGVVSFGISCGNAIPSIYTRVAHYLSWIESIVWPST